MKLDPRVIAAIAAALSGQTATVKAKPAVTRKGRGTTTNEWHQRTVAAFTKAGYKGNQPEVNILTHAKWREQDRMVKFGQHGLQVGPWTLFHIDQTQPTADYMAEKAIRDGQPKAVNDNAAPRLPTIEELEALLATLKGQQAGAAALDAEYGPAH